MRNCTICEKGYKKGNSKSHSQQTTIRRLGVNLQWLNLPGGKRVKACARCIKSVSRGKLKV
ncbi:MAG: 50S ribosomal protein L28 [Candidatus Doudnabacteria bacterium CG10_big_fil_rev_8_21_14_0_10_41_10]|uniref:50S ribosomal protein L28 n=1 Tax=Candidatus Doudnabacteria bacterium CG10_big_fil_rev_8_21_14_0_10_41_10 TaxID=1974551 RepID=A0A2H0VCT8_9BACT|nr:MAG: 50S ribosomal protein L28 [Candidatus Doudnabacteria bacterium CG10_big_fil_rev_8_21_14_0_10_41_10]